MIIMIITKYSNVGLGSRRTWRTYSWRKAGGIRDFDSRKTWAKTTAYWTSNGCTTYGDPIVSSRMPKKSRSTKWAYPIITCGCTTTKHCCTCQSMTNRRVETNGYERRAKHVVSPPKVSDVSENTMYIILYTLRSVYLYAERFTKYARCSSTFSLPNAFIRNLIFKIVKYK